MAIRLTVSIHEQSPWLTRVYVEQFTTAVNV